MIHKGHGHPIIMQHTPARNRYISYINVKSVLYTEVELPQIIRLDAGLNHTLSPPNAYGLPKKSLADKICRSVWFWLSKTVAS